MRFLALSFWVVLPVWGASIDFSGTITTTDPTFDRPSSASVLSGRQTAYQTSSLVAGAGPWSVSGDYTAGGTAYGVSTGLEGFLYLYSSFDPQNPLADLVGADDDEDVDGAGSAARQDFSLIASSDSFGSGVSGNILTLVPGQTYTVVVTSYEEPGSTTFGPIGVGAFNIHVEGVEAVPEPGTCGLAACALAWAIFRRR